MSYRYFRKCVVLLLALYALALPGVSLAQVVTPVPPILLNNSGSTDGASLDLRTRMATDGKGNWLAVWQSDYDLDGAAGGDWDIFVAHSSDDGLTWSDPQLLNSTGTLDNGTDSSDMQPEIAYGQGDTWVVVWYSDYSLGDDDTDDTDVFFSRSVDNGATWSPVDFLNSHGDQDLTQYDQTPAIATDGAGTWVSVWESNLNFGANGSDGDLLYARSIDNGVSWSNAQVLHDSATVDGPSSTDVRPAIAASPTGTFVVAWEGAYNLDFNSGDEPDIFFVRSTTGGATWGATGHVNSFHSETSAQDAFVHLANDGGNNWVAVWSSDYPLSGSGTDRDIMAATSTNNGLSWGTARLVNSNAGIDGTAVDTTPRIITDRDGRWVTAWQSFSDLDGTIGTDPDILAAVSFSTGATWGSPALLNSVGDSDGTVIDESPELITDRRGRWLGAWTSRFDLNGTAGSDPDVLITRFSVVPGDFDVTLSTNYPTAVNSAISVTADIGSSAIAFDAEDFETTNAIVTGFAGESDHFYFVLIPIAAGPFTVRVPAGAFPDQNGQENTESNTLSHVYTPPANGSFVPSPAAALNSTATFDSPNVDSRPHVAMDSTGNGVSVWAGTYALSGGGPDREIFYARTADGGATWSNAEVLNTHAASDAGAVDANAHIATADGGTWIAVWDSEYDFGGVEQRDTDIVFARSTDQGASWSNSSLLNNVALLDSAVTDTNPTVTGDGQGNWVAVWQSRYDPIDNFGGDIDIVFSYSHDDGVTWSDTAMLNSTYSGDALSDTRPQIATDRNGTWIAVWQGPGTVDTQDIYYAKSIDNGETWSPAIAIAATDRAETYPGVATDGAGNWVVVCESDFDLDGDVNADVDIVAVTSSDNGDTWSAMALVNADAATEGNFPQFSPHVHTDGMGNWLCAWHTAYNAGPFGPDLDVFVAQSTDNGATWGPERHLNTEYDLDGGSDDTTPVLADDGLGHWLAIWESEYDIGGVTGGEGDILFSRFDLRDGIAPQVQLSTPDAPLVNGAVTIDVLLSEPVQSFTTAFITAANATVSNLSGAGVDYSFTLTPIADGTFSVLIEEDALLDLAGNTNEASNVISFSFDGTAPQITLDSSTASPTNGSITIDVTLTESVNTFDATDVQVSNGAISGFAGSGLSYSFTLVPSVNGPVTAQVAANAFTDAAGNGNVASAILSVDFDGTGPGITLTEVGFDPITGVALVEAAISEPVSTFDAGDITLSNAAITGFSGSGDAYTFTLTPLAVGAYTAQVAAATFADVAGNSNTASNTLSLVFSALPGCLAACVGDPTPLDEDSDGLTACIEDCYGTSDNAIDSDEDGMPDRFEVDYELDNAIDDAFGDDDDDAYTNLEEFLQGSDPTDADSPSPVFYVSPQGIDQQGGGTAANPFASIAFALEETSSLPAARIVLREGNYEENVVLNPGTSLSGPLEGTATIYGHVTGAEGSELARVSMRAVGSPAVMLIIDNVVMTVRQVDFRGNDTRNVQGILVYGLDSADSLIELCDFSAMSVGIHIYDNIPLIRRCTFGELTTAGIVIEDGQFDERDKPLGHAANSATGFNTFYRTAAGSKAVVNLRSTSILIENNDWNTDDTEVAQESVEGPGKITPKLPAASAIFASSVFVTVWVTPTLDRITNGTVALAPGGFNPVTQNKDGVYTYPAVLPGNYGVQVTAPGFEGGNKQLVVPEGQVVSILVALGQNTQAADTNSNGRVDLSEVLRVIQLYNAATFHCGGGEDGFAVGPGATNCPGHTSDYKPQNWSISLSELLRLIQYFSAGTYYACSSEDGYCPGP